MRRAGGRPLSTWPAWRLDGLAGDLRGGMPAAVVMLAIEGSYGLIAFSSLGPSHQALAFLCGLYAAAACNVLMALFGARGPMLRGNGRRIAVMELDDALFFGTADAVVSEIDQLGRETLQIVVDFRRVTEVDANGARVLLQAAEGLDVVVSRNGKPLARITRLQEGKRPVRFGVLKGEVSVPADFDEPLSDDVRAGLTSR